MDNKKKSLISAAVGAALLLSGGTTFALWQSAGTLGQGEVNTGYLTLDTAEGSWLQFGRYVDAAGVWRNAPAAGVPLGTRVETLLFDEQGDPIMDGDSQAVDVSYNFSGFRMVPGDKLRATFTNAVTAAGDNIDWNVAYINGLPAGDLSVWGLTSGITRCS